MGIKTPIGQEKNPNHKETESLKGLPPANQFPDVIGGLQDRLEDQRDQKLAETVGVAEIPKRKPGRPKGAKNKSLKALVEATKKQSPTAPPAPTTPPTEPESASGEPQSAHGAPVERPVIPSSAAHHSKVSDQLPKVIDYLKKHPPLRIWRQQIATTTMAKWGRWSPAGQKAFLDQFMEDITDEDTIKLILERLQWSTLKAYSTSALVGVVVLCIGWGTWNSLMGDE